MNRLLEIANSNKQTFNKQDQSPSTFLSCTKTVFLWPFILLKVILIRLFFCSKRTVWNILLRCILTNHLFFLSQYFTVILPFFYKLGHKFYFFRLFNNFYRSFHGVKYFLLYSPSRMKKNKVDFINRQKGDFYLPKMMIIVDKWVIYKCL